MNAIKSMSDSLEADYEDLDSIHKKLSKILTTKLDDKFSYTQRDLVNAIAQIANAKLGIFKNYKIQKQLDEMSKLIDRLPDDVKRQYFAIQLTE